MPPGLTAITGYAQKCGARFVPALQLAHHARWASAVAHSDVDTASSSASAGSPLQNISKILVANRGEIACRVITSAKSMGVRTVAVYSDADRGASHVEMADEAYYIGGAAARDSYLKASTILDVAKRCGAQAIHPGYGFLSENARFAEMCAKEGIRFVGPPAAAIRAMGDKAQAKRMMSAAGVPVVPGYHGDDQSEARLLAEAAATGFPLLVKAVSGGGGKGMKLAHSLEEVPAALASAQREARAAFGDDRLLLERYVQRPRHVEVQVIADARGGAFYVFDRDCSVQRRHQKIIEEAPAPGLSDDFHTAIGEAAVRAARAAGYVNAGTVEFIVDMGSPGREFYFMEMNTRLQVEHPVSEAVSGLDLVQLQLRVADGQKLPLVQGLGALARPRGHAFEARLYAETPRANFLPGAGTLVRWRPPPGAVTFTPPSATAITQPDGSTMIGSSSSGGGVSAAPATAGSAATAAVHVRVDSGVREGDAVGINYDPMIAKLIVWGPDRATALAALREALARTQVAGLPINIPFLQRLAAHPAFAHDFSDELDTAFISRHRSQLLAPQSLDKQVAALAAVARRLLHIAAGEERQQQASQQAAAAASGPWAINDSKRLWHHMVRVYDDMTFPEGAGAPGAAGASSSPSASAAAAAAAATPPADGGSQVALQLTVLSERDFEVTCQGPGITTSGSSSSAAGTATAGAPPSGAAAGAAAGGSGAVVRVRGAALVGPDRLEAEVDGCRLRADVVIHTRGDEEVMALWVEGHECGYEFRWPVPSWSRDAGEALLAHHASMHGGKVVAPMPGRVVKVLVGEGEQVKPGAPVLLLEAMKMEHAVCAPRGGTVRGLEVKEGMQVSDHQLLMYVDAPEQQQRQ